MCAVLFLRYCWWEFGVNYGSWHYFAVAEVKVLQDNDAKQQKMLKIKNLYCFS